MQKVSIITSFQTLLVVAPLHIAKLATERGPGSPPQPIDRGVCSAGGFRRVQAQS